MENIRSTMGHGPFVSFQFRSSFYLISVLFLLLAVPTFAQDSNAGSRAWVSLPRQCGPEFCVTGRLSNPIAGSYSTLFLSFTSPSGQSVDVFHYGDDGQILIGPDVAPWMSMRSPDGAGSLPLRRDHSQGHGSRPTQVARQGVGNYLVTMIYWVMPGAWQMEILGTVFQNGARRPLQETIFPVLVVRP